MPTSLPRHRPHRTRDSMNQTYLPPLLAACSPSFFRRVLKARCFSGSRVSGPKVVSSVRRRLQGEPLTVVDGGLQWLAIVSLRTRTAASKQLSTTVNVPRGGTSTTVNGLDPSCPFVVRMDGVNGGIICLARSAGSLVSSVPYVCQHESSPCDRVSCPGLCPAGLLQSESGLAAGS